MVPRGGLHQFSKINDLYHLRKLLTYVRPLSHSD